VRLPWLPRGVGAAAELGGVIICEILNILEGYPMKDLGFRSAQAVHYQIEAMRHAYVDRNSYLGDPDFVKNPIA
jgi:gamma-glutamyltranspeptidase/glutathione hydrolase